jgi:3-hydroxy-3-methylglutaryl CoA synthase
MNATLGAGAAAAVVEKKAEISRANVATITLEDMTESPSFLRAVMKGDSLD